MTRTITRIARIALLFPFICLGWAFAQTVTGVASPATPGISTAFNLTLNYAGFATQNAGYKFRIYYDSAKLTFVDGSPTSTVPGDYQGDSGALADGGNGDGDASTNSYVELNWADFTITWPNAASGVLAVLPFTTSATFNGTTINLRESSTGGQIRNAPSSSVVLAGPPPAITIARNNATVADNGTAITYTVTATPAQAITVNLTSGVTGTMTGVANTCGATITTSGAGTATCAISASNTVPFDGPATATVTIGAATATPYNGAGNSASGTITNDDLPTVTVTPPTASVNETGATSTNVTFTLSTAAPTGGFVVPITMTGATSRVSGTCSGASVTIAAASQSTTCSVQAVDNAIADGTQTVTVASNCTSTCTNAAGSGSSVVSVLDNDQPTINVTCLASTLPDNGATTTCTFRNSTAIGASGFSVPFTFTADNSRHTVTGCASPIVVAANTAANSSLATCTVTAVANVVVGDGADAVTLAITAGAGYSAGLPATVAITDNDLSTIGVAVAPASVTENSGTPLTYTFTSSLASIAATTVNFTLPANAARYTIGGSAGCATGSVVLAAAATSFTCTVTPVNTLIVDGNVTATATITPSASYTVAAAPANAATGTITDDDVTVTVTPLSATEGSAVTFTIACTGPAGVSVTGLSFGVTPAQDVGAAVATPGMSGAVGPLICGSTFLVTVPTFNDTIIGNTRAHTLALTGSPVASNNGSVTLPVAAAVAQVLDNDVPLVVPTMSAVGLGMLALLIFGFVAFGQRRRVE